MKKNKLIKTAEFDSENITNKLIQETIKWLKQLNYSTRILCNDREKIEIFASKNEEDKIGVIYKSEKTNEICIGTKITFVNFNKIILRKRYFLILSRINIPFINLS